MLVLSRKVNQQLVIPEYNITITIVAVAGEKVRVGIEAPSNIKVWRPEVLAKIDREPELAK